MPPTLATKPAAKPAAKLAAKPAEAKADPFAVQRIVAEHNARSAAPAEEPKIIEALDSEENMPGLSAAPTKRVTLGELNCAINILHGLSDQPFDGGAAHAILIVKKWAYPHFARYVKSREELLDKYATRVEPGKWNLPVENQEAAAVELHRLDSELVALDSSLAGVLSPRMFYRAQITPNHLEQLSIFY